MVFDVVDLKLPLLISLKVMQKLKIRIQYDDEDQETAEIGGRIVNLLNSQGHHWISLSKKAGVQGSKDQEQHESQVLLSNSSPFSNDNKIGHSSRSSSIQRSKTTEVVS